MSYSQMMERVKKDETRQKILNGAKNNYPVDPRYWTPAQDKNGAGKAVVRFLPAPEGETEDFAKFFTHYITGAGGKRYIERCRTTLGEDDPAQSLAKALGANNKELYMKYGRTPRFVANVLVLQDLHKPENNGKVFLFEFGNKIMKKILGAMEGSDDPIDPRPALNILNPIDGANFIVEVKKVGGQNNYDESKFQGPSALFNGDHAKIEAVWKTAHKLQPLIAPSTFKSYAELRKALINVVGEGLVSQAETGEAVEAEEVETKTESVTKAAKTETTKVKATETPTTESDPDKVFDELLSGTEGLSGDAVVDAMFND